MQWIMTIKIRKDIGGNNMSKYPSKEKPWLKFFSEAAILSALPKKTMYEYLYEKNENHLDDIALICDGRSLTYKEFVDAIHHVAKALYHLGVRKKDTVTIMSVHTIETIIAVYAVNYLGAVANMAYITLSSNEIVKMINNTNSVAYIVLDSALERVMAAKSEIKIPIVILPSGNRNCYGMDEFLTWESLMQIDIASFAPVKSDEHEAPALIVYTSGSTGNPKGVVLSSDALNAINAQFSMTPRASKWGNIYLHTIPVFVAFGIGMLHHGLCSGETVVLGIAQDVDEMGKLFAEIRPHRFVTGPPVLDSIMKYTTGDLSRCIDFGGGGEAITAEKEDEFNLFLKDHNSSAQYFAGYGMTEFGSVATFCMRHAYKRGSVGIPLMHANAKIVDVDTGRELSYGNVGELCMTTPSLMIGYYNDPESTMEVMSIDDDGTHWMHTGDLAYIDPDGFVFIIGRLKRIYLTQEENGSIVKIYPQYIENAIVKELPVENCGVVMRKDDKRINVPVAFITIRADSGMEESRLIECLLEKLQGSLPSYDVPDHIEILSDMPLTQSGKIDYKTLEMMTEEIFRSGIPGKN